MSPAVNENLVINSPYETPRRHFPFGDDGITDELVEPVGSVITVEVQRVR